MTAAAPPRPVIDCPLCQRQRPDGTWYSAGGWPSDTGWSVCGICEGAQRVRWAHVEVEGKWVQVADRDEPVWA